VSGSESDPGADNNTVTSVTSVSSSQPSPPQPIDGPDFTGSWQSITQSCKGSGATQQCKLKGTVVVENRGTQKADSSALQFYLSDNSAFDAGDTLLASTTTSSIKIDKVKKKKLKVTLPIGSNASGQYVIAVLDPVNSEAERNESNNAVSSGSVP
jgi:subtilase family serine protease